MKRFLLIFAALMILNSISNAEIINVPEDFDTIQEAIEASEENDSILVALGEYAENLDFSGRNISLIGNPENPEQVIISNPENGAVISSINDEVNENAALIEGFTITGGNGIEGQQGGGGLLLIRSSPTIRNCIITQNDVTRLGGNSKGGGIYCVGGVPTIEDCLISENTAGDGGGIAIETGCIMENVHIIGNNARDGDDGDGGGIYLHGPFCLVELTNCLLSENSGIFSSGIYSHRAMCTLVKCEISNHDGFYGAAILRSNSQIDLVNCTIANNRIDERVRDRSIIEVGSGILNISNCIIRNPDESEIAAWNEGLSLSVEYSLVCGGENGLGDGIGELNWGENNIDDDPLFANLDEGNFHLTVDSPCIDAGDPDSPQDPDGSRADMGAFYFHQRDIEVEPRVLMFGETEVGAIDSLPLIIANTGGTMLTIEQMSWTENNHPFFTRNSDELLPAGINSLDTLLLWIICQPTQPGQADWGGCTIMSDDPDESEIDIEATFEVLNAGQPGDLPPSEFEIAGVYPNPFNSATTIAYTLPTKSPVTLQIYNTRGQLVDALANRLMPAGSII